MSKTARLYQDTRAASAGSSLDRLNDDLQDVTRIMTKNMEELLWRGDSLDSAFPSAIDCFSTNDLFVHRDVAFVKFVALRVRKISQGGTEHQFQCDAAPICSFRCYTFYFNHSYLVEVHMTFRPRLPICLFSSRVLLFAGWGTITEVLSGVGWSEGVTLLGALMAWSTRGRELGIYMRARFIVILSLVVSDPCRYIVHPALSLMGLLALSRVHMVCPRQDLQVKSSPEQ